MKRIRHFLSTLEGRLTGLFILTSSVIFIANVMLFSSLNSAMNQIDQVFSSNVQIIQVQTYLNDIQAELTSYLNTNSSAALQKVYQSESRYSTALSEIRILSNDSNIQADLENIRNLSDGYLTLCQEMLSAKRGRNVQRYRENYDQATDYCSYLQSYLYSLNQLQLQSNSTNYVTLRQSFAALEGLLHLHPRDGHRPEPCHLLPDDPHLDGADAGSCRRGRGDRKGEPGRSRTSCSLRG